MAGTVDEAEALAQARAFPGPGRYGSRESGELRQALHWNETEWALGRVTAASRPPRYHVVAFDYGVKRNILRKLASRGCKLTVLPAQAPREEALALKPDGVFLSNGPGDPEPCDYAIRAIRELLDAGVPIFGICLGPSAAWPGQRCAHRQDEVRPSRRQPSGAGSGHRPRDDHQPEPWLCGRCGRRCRRTCA